MILPIVAYGDPVLRKETAEIDADYPKLKELIANMFETMYASHGVGLAAPQIGLPIRLFIVDGEPIDEKNLKGFRKVFINPYIVEEEGDAWDYEEGCLSIPNIRENVKRLPRIRLEYQDENFEFHDEVFEGIAARIIQHEHDHIEGILFLDHVSAFKRRLLKNKLADISKGKIHVDYKMKFPVKK
jgi:peptide deformylase